MDTKENFKEFVKQNPNLISHVKTGDKTWQDFYELYNLYGDEGSHWDEYISTNGDRSANITSAVAGAGLGNILSNMTFKDIFGYVKSIDMDNLKSNIETVQRGLGMFQDFAKKDTSSTKGKGSTNNFYQPRARGRFFDD